MSNDNLNRIYKKQAISQSCLVNQFDINNNYIKTLTTREAADELNIDINGITKCCRNPNRYKSYKNFKWEYANDPDLPNEIWKELDNELSGLHISNMGRYYTKTIKKSYGTNCNNIIVLKYKNKKYQLDKLVLIAFNVEDNINKIINHIDGDLTNNKLENLRWINKNEKTHNRQYNTLKSIVQLKDDIEINKYNSIKEASEYTNINQTNISACINEKQKTAGGFKWKIDNPDLTDEEWKEHPILKIYVSNMGRIQIKKKNIKTYGTLNINGYYMYNKHRVHRLVAETFLENIERKLTVDHIDGDTKNNKINNLRWATNQEQYYNRR